MKENEPWTPITHESTPNLRKVQQCPCNLWNMRSLRNNDADRTEFIFTLAHACPNMPYTPPGKFWGSGRSDHGSKLRKMESTLAFVDGDIQFFFENFHRTVIWHFEIVDTGHNAREVVVRGVRRLAWLADHCEHRCKAFETCNYL